MCRLFRSFLCLPLERLLRMFANNFEGGRQVTICLFAVIALPVSQETVRNTQSSGTDGFLTKQQMMGKSRSKQKTR